MRWDFCDVEYCDDLCDRCTVEECGSADVQQTNYRGPINTTITGKNCLPWSDSHPNFTAEMFPDSDLQGNACRNPTPEDRGRAWCHTTDVEWEYCKVPDCGVVLSPEKYFCGSIAAKQADYLGTQSHTVTGRTCQRWDSQTPHGHSNSPEEKPVEENYCRNPDNEDKAWCYTTGMFNQNELQVK